MKNLNLFGMALVLIVSILSCKKDNPAPTPQPTSLEITVVDNVGNIISGAVVKIYKSYDDWNSQLNVISSQTTDIFGKVSFTYLNPTKYFWLASKDCLNNINESNTTTTNLTSNVINKVNCMLSSTGTLVFTNNSSNPYQVYINGTLSFVADPNTMYTKNYEPAVAYVIRVLQVSGYLVSPTDLTYNGTLTCGSKLTTTFPN
jgi:hypothetical protein